MLSTANAKINLFLRVVGKRNDGYHLLQSLFYYCEYIYDEITIAENNKHKQIDLRITGDFAHNLSTENADNIIIKAYDFMCNRFPKISLNPLITLNKKLPIASGIGGGSADAACVINFLLNRYDIPLSAELILDIANNLGADIPPALIGKTQLVSGIGEQLQIIENFPRLNILLVNPLISISTQEVFNESHFHFENNKTIDSSKLLLKLNQIISIDDEGKKLHELVQLLQDYGNDLRFAATKKLPKITNIIASISAQKGCLFSNMSGSGATCFGIFDSRHNLETAAKILRNSHAKYWVAF